MTIDEMKVRVYDLMVKADKMEAEYKGVKQEIASLHKQIEERTNDTAELENSEGSGGLASEAEAG